MKINRFDEGFEDIDGAAYRRPSVDSRPARSPALGDNHKSDVSFDPEPDFGFGDAHEREPDYGPDDLDDQEPEPEPHELWPRTEEGLEEPPAVPAAPALQSPPEPIGDSLAGEQRLRQARQPKATAPFIMGPLCREWVVSALHLRKSAAAVGLGLWHRAGLEKDDFIRGRRVESRPIRVDRRLKKQFGITPSQCSRGLFALRAAGLIRVVKDGPGRCQVVTIVNLQTQHTDRDKANP